MEPTNDERADCAMAACHKFADATGMSVTDELLTVIIDLIADLMHLANREGMCAKSCVDTARMHYEAEQEEDE